MGLFKFFLNKIKNLHSSSKEINDDSNIKKSKDEKIVDFLNKEQKWASNGNFKLIQMGKRYL